MINVDKNELRNRTNCTNAYLINLIRPFANEDFPFFLENASYFEN